MRDVSPVTEFTTMAARILDRRSCFVRRSARCRVRRLAGKCGKRGRRTSFEAENNEFASKSHGNELGARAPSKSWSERPYPGSCLLGQMICGHCRNRRTPCLATESSRVPGRCYGTGSEAGVPGGGRIRSRKTLSPRICPGHGIGQAVGGRPDIRRRRETQSRRHHKSMHFPEVCFIAANTGYRAAFRADRVRLLLGNGFCS